MNSLSPHQRNVSYNVGDEVEVIGKEKGFIGSYYQATVVSVLDDDGRRYEIQYKTLIEDEETNIPVKEVVLPKDLRPTPPRVPTSGVFKLYQSVDVRANEGWWYGRITGKINGGYSVYFISTNEELPYHCSLIRVHHDFIGGDWIQPN